MGSKIFGNPYMANDKEFLQETSIFLYPMLNRPCILRSCCIAAHHDRIIGMGEPSSYLTKWIADLSSQATQPRMGGLLGTTKPQQ